MNYIYQGSKFEKQEREINLPYIKPITAQWVTIWISYCFFQKSMQLLCVGYSVFYTVWFKEKEEE